MSEKKVIPIRYTNRDFNSIRNALIEHAKRYYPDSYKDLSEAGLGSFVIDGVSYIGDILSFYLDYQANESFPDSALEYSNVLRHAKRYGYKAPGSASSFGDVELYLVVPAAADGPDERYMPVLRKGTTFTSTGGVNFLLLQNVDFSASNDIVVAQVNETTGVPLTYVLMMKGKVVSGILGVEYVEVGSFQEFLKLELETPYVSEILSVVDTEGHEYYEVSSLSQNTVYRSITNHNENTKLYAPNLLRPYIVPRRFVVDREGEKTFLQFGTGTNTSDNVPYLADPSNVAVNAYGKNYVSDTSFEPTRLLNSDKYGVVPSNTTLRVAFRTNNVGSVNAGVNTVTIVAKSLFEFRDVTALENNMVSAVRSSLEVNNETTIIGDVSLLSSEEIKVRAVDAFAAQQRAVTEQDYRALTYAMPAQFGAIKRVNVVRGRTDTNARKLDLYVCSEDRDGYMIQTNEAVKENLRFWLLKHKMLGDVVDIRDAKIVNLGIEFEILSSLNRDKYDVFQKAVLALREYFVKVPGIGENFFLTDVYSVLKDVEDVLDVMNLRVYRKEGAGYSSVHFDVDVNLSSDERYIKCPANVIFEIKYPSNDIKGTIR